MKTHLPTTVLAALIIGAASLSAVAQPRSNGPNGPGGAGPGPAPQAQSAPYESPRQPQAHQGGRDSRPMPPRGGAHAAPHPSQQGMQPGHVQRMGAGPDHQWMKGSRMPAQYRSHNYVVQDWQSHGLKRPGRGQQWVQNGGDYLLVAVASGVIAQLILGH